MYELAFNTFLPGHLADAASDKCSKSKQKLQSIFQKENFMQTNIIYDTPDPDKIRSEYEKGGNLTSIPLAGGIVPDHIQLIRAGVNDRKSLRNFLASGRKWAELDVRLNTVDDSLILRKHSFEKIPLSARENLFTLDECLDVLFSHNKGAKINIHETGNSLSILMKKLGYSRFNEHNMRFYGRIDDLGGHDFMELAQNFPGSHIECSMDFMVQIILETPAKGEHILSLLTSWGINSFSLNWDTVERNHVIDYMNGTGYKVNIYNIPDIETLTEAVLLHPSSISCDFDIPGSVPSRKNSK